jgi:nucleotide-binding universal stress UspA family protein
MNKILIPLDGSRSAHSAIDYVVSRKMDLQDAEILLVNVQPLATAGKAALVLASDEIEALRREAGQEVLHPARDELTAHGLRCTTHVLVGQPAETIARYAGTQNCTSIVMGTRGMGSFRNFISRSVPTTVVHLSTVPVTLVRDSRSGSVESPITARRRRPHQGAMESRNSTVRRSHSAHSIPGMGEPPSYVPC